MSSSNRTRLTRFEPRPRAPLPRGTRSPVRASRSESCRGTLPECRPPRGSRGACAPGRAFRQRPAFRCECPGRIARSFEGHSRSCPRPRVASAARTLAARQTRRPAGVAAGFGAEMHERARLDLVVHVADAAQQLGPAAVVVGARDAELVVDVLGDAVALPAVARQAADGDALGRPALEADEGPVAHRRLPACKPLRFSRSRSSCR